MLEELNYQEMSEIKGGVTREEYCSTLMELILSDYADQNWTREEWISAGNALRTHCVD